MIKSETRTFVLCGADGLFLNTVWVEQSGVGVSRLLEAPPPHCKFKLFTHTLNTGLDLQSLFGLLWTAVLID